MERIFGRNLYTEGCHNYPKFDFLWKECEIIGDIGISYKTFEKCAIVEWMDLIILKSFLSLLIMTIKICHNHHRQKIVCR